MRLAILWGKLLDGRRTVPSYDNPGLARNNHFSKCIGERMGLLLISYLTSLQYKHRFAKIAHSRGFLNRVHLAMLVCVVFVTIV